MKNKKYRTFGTIPISDIKIIERGKIYIPTIQMHDRGISMKGGADKQGL